MKANPILQRYYLPASKTISCEVVTPMFLGNADQEAEWRAAPFKALFRYWWRVSRPGLPLADLRQEEREIFGGVGYKPGEEAAKSHFSLQIKGDSQSARKENFATNLKIRHPEVSLGGGQIPSLLYLAGMGLLQPDGRVKHSYFPAGTKFELHLHYPRDMEQSLASTLALVKAFGALGARCRNGWGSFQPVKPGAPDDEAQLLDKITQDWKQGFNKDYPNCLGEDEKGPLLWKTRQAAKKWEECLHSLADVYVKVRTSLDVDGQDWPGERHLLGFPVTNHPASRQQGWGAEARHASPLRLFVRRRPEGFVGFILHLPFAHSQKMTLPQQINQLAVWQKVHQHLDNLMDRAGYRDCLV